MEMVDMLYISALIFSVAVLILVIYISRTLTSVKRTMKTMEQTLSGMESQLQGIATEAEILMKKTNRLADDLQHKSESLNVVFDLINDVGESLKKVKATVAKFGFSDKESAENNRTSNWLNLAMKAGKNYFKNKENDHNG